MYPYISSIISRANTICPLQPSTCHLSCCTARCVVLSQHGCILCLLCTCLRRNTPISFLFFSFLPHPPMVLKYPLHCSLLCSSNYSFSPTLCSSSTSTH